MSDNETTPPDPPYEYEDVVAVLIEGMADFTYIKKGSLQVGNLDDIKTLTADDQFDGSKVFFFARRLVAVKYEPPGLTTVDGGVGHIARPLP